MKCLSFLLAFYLLCMALLPCSDQPGERLSVLMKGHVEHAHDDHTHSDSPDLCGPFCACNCCGAISGYVFQATSVEITVPILSRKRKQLPYHKNPPLSNYSDTIWQPPKHVV